MSYLECFKAAGAEVLSSVEHAMFEGAYEGDGLAKVRVNGAVGFIQWGYGSCCGCDAYESFASFECGNSGNPTREEQAEFGRGYLASMVPLADALEWAIRLDDDLSWDDDDSVDGWRTIFVRTNLDTPTTTPEPTP